MAARPATRRTTDRPATAPSRPAVRDFSRGPDYTIEWDVRPVYDFIFSLSEEAGSTDDLPAADRQWLADARASLPQDIRASVSHLVESEAAIQLASFAIERPELRTPAQFVDAIAGEAPATVLRISFGPVERDARTEELLERVLAGDDAALPDLAAALPDWLRETRLAMLRDPAGTHAEIVRVLRAWLGVFDAVTDRVAAMGERDYALRAADRETLAPAELIERATSGLRWLGEPGVRRVILAPSYFARPYNYLMAGADWRFFGYPLADAAFDRLHPLAPPGSVLRLHRALGDETRLRILKLLAGGDLYLTEIAQHLELSKPTIKHHLAILRSAGAVTVTEAGSVIYYTLRRQALEEASTELMRFLETEARTRRTS
jgi:DNA-binding transcriptional ArsR family regulator